MKVLMCVSLCEFIRESDWKAIKEDDRLSGILQPHRVMPLPGEHSLYSHLAVPLFTSSSSPPLKASISCIAQQNFKLFHWHDKQRSPILWQNKKCAMMQTPVHTEFCLTLSDNFVRQVGELVFTSAWISVTRETCVWLTKINYSQYVLGWAGVYIFFTTKCLWVFSLRLQQAD